MSNTKQITEKGFQDLQEELLNRKTTIRKKIADDIETARAQGDLSENSAYKSAIEAKEFNENRINKLEELINNSQIVIKTSSNKIHLGSKVTVKNLKSNSNLEYTIVGENEADPSQKLISLSSPIGSALMNKKQGEKFQLSLPSGEVEFLIIEVK